MGHIIWGQKYSFAIKLKKADAFEIKDRFANEFFSETI
jgi:hypothetical protein